MDGLGSVVGEVDPSGNLTCSRGFDVYGATRVQTGTPTSKHGFVGKLGHETEDASGLVYMRARWYDRAVGRFISEDSKEKGSNWFLYGEGNPVNEVDRDGHNPWLLAILGILSVVFLILEVVDKGLELREIRDGLLRRQHSLQHSNLPTAGATSQQIPNIDPFNGNESQWPGSQPTPKPH